MRIAFLTPEYVTPKNPDGGLANYLKKTARALTEQGHEVEIFLSSNCDNKWKDDDVVIHEVKRNNNFEQNLLIFPFLRIFAPLISQYFAAKNIARKFWEMHRISPFDIIQASSYQALGYALLRNGKVPVVCRVSSYTPLYRSAYGTRRSFVEYLRDWFEIKQVLDADASFGPSKFIANIFERTEAFRPYVIHSPLEISEIELDQDYYNSHRPISKYLLFFGTLSRIKGVDLIADIINPIIDKHPDISFLFIGRDDGMPDGKKCFDYIISKCKSNEKKLLYYPAMPKSKLYPFVANAEAILMPSRVDNYPNTCLESQVFGIPVIGFDNSSLEEMIIDGETGFLARNSDTSDLFRAIDRFLNRNKEAREQMKQKILSHVQAIKDEDRLKQLIDYYQKTITGYNKIE